MPRTVTIAAPTDAPDETPKVYGEASGLCKTDCVTAPPTDIAAPVKNASKTLGMRMPHMITDEVSCGFVNMIFKVFKKSIPTLPTEIPMSTISADTGMSTAIAALERLSAESAVVLALRI